MCSCGGCVDDEFKTWKQSINFLQSLVVVFDCYGQEENGKVYVKRSSLSILEWWGYDCPWDQEAQVGLDSSDIQYVCLSIS